MPSADRTNSLSDAGIHTNASWIMCPPPRLAFDPTENSPLRMRISCPLLQVNMAKTEGSHAGAAGGGVADLVRHGSTRYEPVYLPNVMVRIKPFLFEDDKAYTWHQVCVNGVRWEWLAARRIAFGHRAALRALKITRAKVFAEWPATPFSCHFRTCTRTA